MRRKFRSLTSVFGLLACLILPACQNFMGMEQLAGTDTSDGAGDTEVSFESVRAEDPQSKIGARSHPQVLQANGGVYESQKLEELLAVIVGRLVPHSNDPGRAYNITILDSPLVNAFALPGGYLYVTRGLLALANDASEVAAVLAHEMVHVSSNHGVLRSREAEAVDIADRVTSEVVTNPVAAKVAKASTDQRLATFSQKQELEADAISIRMLGAAGYDPFAAARFLDSMNRFSTWRSKLNDDRNDMSSTHPSTPRRIELARRHARLIGPPGTGERNRERYLAGIEGLIFGDRGEDGVVRENHFFHVKLGVTFAVPLDFELNNRDEAVLASGPGEIAMRFDAEDKNFPLSSPVSYLKSGWVNGLITETVQARRIDGLSAATGEAIAGDWRFVVTVVELRGRYFRFIVAAPRFSGEIEDISQSISGSFRRLSRSEKSTIRPLRIKVVKVEPSDGLESLAQRMVGMTRKTGLFKSLNGHGPGDRPKVGAMVKLVVEQ